MILSAIYESYNRWKYLWLYDPTRYIRKALHKRSDIFIVQIGSNDGVTGDPLHSLVMQNGAWSALFIEPVPYLFEKLLKTYGQNDRFRFENIAVTSRRGTARFYYVDPLAIERVPDLPNWHDQLGSFDKSHIVEHFGDQIWEHIVEMDVPTETLVEILKKHDIKKIDLLHIDAEGHDWIILQQLDLQKYHPEVILFEHAHLSIEAKRAVSAFLEKNYKMIYLGMNCFCRRKKCARMPPRS